MRQLYWWLGLKQDIACFEAQCLTCQQVKAEHQHPIWVIVDRLTKSVHFLPIRTTYPPEKLGSLYVKEIVRLHGVPVSIVSGKDTHLTSGFRKSL